MGDVRVMATATPLYANHISGAYTVPASGTNMYEGQQPNPQPIDLQRGRVVGYAFEEAIQSSRGPRVTDPSRIEEYLRQLQAIRLEYRWETSFEFNFEEPPRDPSFRWPYHQSMNFRGPDNHNWKRRTLVFPDAPSPRAIEGASPVDAVQTIMRWAVVQTNGFVTQFINYEDGVRVDSIVELEFAYNPSDRIPRAFMGTTDCITCHFADIGQFQECDPEMYIAWENRMATDKHYRQQQIEAQKILFEVTGQRSMVFRTPTPTIDNVGLPTKPSDLIEDFKSPCYCITANTPKRRAESLLKQWLTDAEYIALTSNGEIEFPSQYEKDVIYIVKRDPGARVKIKKNNQITEELCIVPTDHSIPAADNLLCKLLLLKTDEKKFLELSNRYPSSETPRDNIRAQAVWDQHAQNVVQCQYNQGQALTAATQTQWVVQTIGTRNTAAAGNYWCEIQTGTAAAW